MNPTPSTGGEGKCRTCNHPKSDHHSLEGECMKLCSNQETSDEWYCDCPRWEPPAPISEGTPAAGPVLESVEGDWDEHGNARYTLIGIKTIDAPTANAIKAIFAPKEGKP